jgi:transposase
MLPSSVRIFVCMVPQDMRRSFDSLALVTRELLGEDPQSGALYIFIGKRPTRIKALWWDRNGYCLLYKRLHRSVFVLPKPESDATSSLRIDGHVLAELLAGVQCEKKRTKTLTTRLH